jgi:manganese/zinc/iron transport system substrate-binding protein
MKRVERAGPRLAMVGLLVAILLVSGSCSSGPGGGAGHAETKDGGHLKVACTIGMIADLARRIGGEDVAVTGLMGPGVDPHLYKASESDITRLASADLVLYNGLHLEGKMGDVLERLGKRRPVVAVTRKIPTDRLTETGGEHHDPHVWFDVSLWTMAAEATRDALIEARPAKKAEFERNAVALLTELKELHVWCGQELAKIPKERRVLVTAHDAFSYFGKVYDLEVHGIQGISTESEAGLKDINALIDLLVTREIKAVFVESSVPRKNIEALVEGCRARGHELAVGGELFSDAMGAAGTPEATYPGMVRHNVNTIVKALQ